MLLACKNDIKEVNALAEREKRPDMTGENLELVYSDSARIKYRVLAPEYIKVNREKEKYEEFPLSIFNVISDMFLYFFAVVCIQVKHSLVLMRSLDFPLLLIASEVKLLFCLSHPYVYILLKK